MKAKNKEVIMMIKFTLFSISAGIVQIASFTLLNEVFKMVYWPAYLISLTLSILWNFTINRKFTFKSANNVTIAMIQVFAFYLVFTPLSTWWGHELTKIGWDEYLVLAGTMLINFTTEFLYDRYYVFGKTINSAIIKEEIE
ncbi:MAG: GtrA family protein [Bacilli bacterium]